MKRILRSLAILALMFVPLATQAQVDCEEYAELPWSSGFEGLQTGQVPACWVQVQTGTNPGLNATFPSAYVHAPNAHNGSVYFEFESTTGQTEVLALPRMEYVSELQLSFWASAVNINFMLEAGVVEEDGEGNYTFVPVDTVNVIQGSSFSGGYHIYNITFENYEGDGERLALRVRGNSNAQYTLMIDDFSVIYAGTPILAPMQAQYTANVNLPLTIAAVLQTGTNVNYDWFSQMAEAGNAEMESNDSLLTITYTAAGIDTIMVVAYNNGGEDTGYTEVHVIDLSPVTEFPYTTSFEEGDDVNWQFANGTNGWHLGTATHNGEGSRALYISNDEGVSNSYSITATTSSYAYRPVGLESGEYAFQYNWICNGESTYDYLRVFLAPGNAEFTANNTLGIGYSGAPSGWIALDGGNKLNQQTSWQTRQGTFTITNGGLYNLVFYWRNDFSTGSMPPAAVDNIMLSPLSCPSVSNVHTTSVTAHTATVEWTPLGEESEWWVVVDGNTANGQLVSETTFELTGLNGQSSHTVSVRAYCGEGDTSFATSVSFTTPVSCPVVSALQAANVGPHTATINWTAGGDEGEWLVVVDGDMENAEVVAENTYVLEGLTPESSHTVIVRAVCGEGDTSANATVSFTTLVSCPPVTAIEVSGATTSSASISWTAQGEEGEWVVYLNGDMENADIIGATNYTFYNLEPMTAYSATVRAVCGEGDTSAVASINFMTAMCDDLVTISNCGATSGSSTTNYGPIGYSLYNYSYVQTIIDSADVAAIVEGTTITAMGFNPTTTTSSTYYTNMDVYLANVSESNLTNGFILPGENHEFVQVIQNGNFNFTETGWQLQTFSEPFVWDGHSNVLVAVNRKHGSWGSSTTFSAHSATEAKMRCIYQDNGAYDINNPSGGTVASNNTTVADIRLYSCGGAAAPTCPTPAISGTEATETTVTVNFNGSANSYEVAIVAGSWVAPAEGTTISTTTHTFSNLTPGTQYAVGVRALCDDDLVSNWAVVTVSTLESTAECLAPSNVVVSNVSMTGATLTWTAADAAQTSWEVNVTGLNYDQTLTASTTTLAVDGLTSGVEYTVKVRAVCGEENYSEWSDAASFTTGVCEAVSNVIVSNITANSATVAWTAAEGQTSWQLDYGPQGHPQGTGATVVVNTNPYTLSGLEEYTPYDIYVRAICSDGVFSDWSVKANFTTLQTEGIEGVNSDLVKLYPNPASTTVTVSGISGEATVSVVDMNGRTVYSERANETLTIDLTGYAQCAYFVRISGEQTLAIRKLIVK